VTSFLSNETSKFNVRVTLPHISEEVGQLSYTDARTSEIANFFISVALEQTRQFCFKDYIPFVMSEHANI
jgi:hypothetical protein